MIHKSVTVFGLFNFVNSIDFFAPIRIVYFQQVTGSYLQSASLLAIVWIAAALFEVPTGIFSDFVGRRKTIIFGALCICLAYIFYASRFNYLVLALGAILQGASIAFYSGNNNAYLYNSLEEKSEEKDFQNYYGKIAALLSSSAFISALLCGIVAGFSFGLLMWLSAMFQIIAFIIALKLPEVTSKRPESTNIYIHLKEAVREIKGNLNLRYISLASIFTGAGNAAYEFHAAVFSAVWPVWAIGIARALQELTITVSYFFSGTILKRLGVINVLLYQNVFSWLGTIVAVFVKSALSPFIIVGGFIFLGVSDTASNTLQQQEFSDIQRATISSLNSLGSSIYFTFVLLIAGYFATKYGPFIGLFTTQMFYIPVIYFRWKLFNRLKSQAL